MKLIVGLGNPGKEYTTTRHNVGFLFIDELAKKWDITLNKEKHKGIYGSGMVQGEKVYLLKPLTYMNLSGECIRPFMDYFDIDIEDVVIVYDDLDLVVGKIRIRGKGSAGGHNGIKSIIQHFGTQEFNRIRIGIDRPKNGKTVIDHVLGNFMSDEVEPTVEAMKLAIDACDTWMSTPFLKVMSLYNGK